MKKGWLAVCLVGLMLAVGYFFPQRMMDLSRERIDRFQAKTELIPPNEKNESDLIGKMALLNAQESLITELMITDAQAREVYERFLTELALLSTFGYRNIPIDSEEFTRNYYVKEQIYIDETQVMRVYVIYSETVFAIVDKESFKILQLGSMVAPFERASDAFYMADEFTKTLHAFASYYGFELGEVSTHEEILLSNNGGTVISAPMADEDGNAFEFGLSLDEGIGYCFIGAVSDTDPIQYGLEEDA